MHRLTRKRLKCRIWYIGYFLKMGGVVIPFPPSVCNLRTLSPSQTVWARGKMRQVAQYQHSYRRGFPPPCTSYIVSYVTNTTFLCSSMMRWDVLVYSIFYSHPRGYRAGGGWLSGPSSPVGNCNRKSYQQSHLLIKNLNS